MEQGKDIIIRQMEERDIESVHAIEVQNFSAPWTKKDFLESISQTMGLYLVAEQDTKIVGYCGLWGVIDEGQINNVAVSKEHQGRGIGKRLVAMLIKKGRESGLKAFTLEVRVSNEAAIHVYKALGFEEVGVRKNFYIAPKEDALIMWLKR